MSRAGARRRGVCGLVAGLSALALLLAAAPAAEAGLVFKRPGGSEIQFAGTPRAWCGPWDDQVARPSLHVALRNARRGWELSAVRRDLTVGGRIEFPNDFVSTRPHGAQLFAFDGAVEASSTEEESSGSIAFSQVSCRLGDVIEFSVDAVLGSELFNGRPVRVSGTYRGHVSKRPDL